MLGGPLLRLGIPTERLSIPPGSGWGGNNTGWFVTWDCPLRSESASCLSIIQLISFCNSWILPVSSWIVSWSSINLFFEIVSNVERWNRFNASISLKLFSWGSDFVPTRSPSPRKLLVVNVAHDIFPRWLDNFIQFLDFFSVFESLFDNFLSRDVDFLWRLKLVIQTHRKTGLLVLTWPTDDELTGQQAFGHDLLRPSLLRPDLLRPGQRKPGLVVCCGVLCVCLCVLLCAVCVRLNT